MKITAILDVDEKVLTELGHSFEEEMGWLVQSGITLCEWKRNYSEDSSEEKSVSNDNMVRTSL